MRKPLWKASLLPCLLFGSACGTSHTGDAGVDAAVATDVGPDSGYADDGGIDAGPGTLDGGGELASNLVEFCVRSREIRCEAADCCTLESRRIDSNCEPAEIRRLCEALGEDPALHDGTLVWNPAAAAQRIESLEAARPTCAAIDRSFSFDRVLDGTLAEGEDCTPHEPGRAALGLLRCREGLRCAISGTVSEFSGRCAPLGQAGDPCNFDCTEGLFCMYTTDLVPWAGYCEVQDDDLECLSDYACLGTLCVVRDCQVPADADTWCNIVG